ncbi:GNAT family N-acetyltransferase [Williamsia sterculiae]|uniref:Predicted acetyltransferase n=1 Tax=Williamsia sterculiae TaxID=1344003 RepID=A0A1N7GVK9_9NOCA|nr:GNAT family N-acetyltransferase [Williamsia sterculiae]SIS16625.1 Predicted acetyltransferase [Williamsia sterculiae]
MSTAAGTLELRRATDDDWDDIIAADARAFAFIHPLDDEAQQDLRRKVRDEDVVVVRDGADLVGVAMFYRMTMTVPGGTRVDIPGLSWVSVAATHRRRGILRMMLTEIFEQWERENFTFAALTASEGTIYERFGFGPACFEERVSVELGRSTFREPAPDDSRVRFADDEQIRTAVPELHDRWSATRSGALARSDVWWQMIFADREMLRDGRSALHYLLHADGYASYRIAHRGDDAVAEVSEIFTVSDVAHTDLWRVLLGLDLIPRVTATIPTDDALPVKLTDLRAVKVEHVADAMWLRILDVPAALAARVYDRDTSFVLEVHDNHRDAGGRFAVDIADGRATVTATTEPPTITTDISVLSSIYLGGYRAVEFARANRLWVADQPTLTAFDQAFSTERRPFSGTFF